MARSKRTLAGFDQVAGNNNNNNIDSDIESIINDDKEKPVFHGVYLEPEVSRMLDALTKGKKGAKSRLVNEALRKIMNLK